MGGTVSIVAGTVRFTPAANHNGLATFKYTVEDNGTTNGTADPKTSAPATAHFNVTEVNDLPTAVAETLANVIEDSGPRTIPFADLTGNDSKGPANESSQTLFVKTVSDAVGGAVSIVAGEVVFAPAPDYSGPASFDYTVEDNGISEETFNSGAGSSMAAEKQALVDGLGNGTETRASVLRKVVNGTVVISEGMCSLRPVTGRLSTSRSTSECLSTWNT